MEGMLGMLAKIGCYRMRKRLQDSRKEIEEKGITREMLSQAFQAIDYDISRKKFMEKIVGRGRGGDGVVNAEKGRYERLNDLTRKYEGSLSVLEDKEGNRMKTVSDLEVEVRVNRSFWHEEPEPISEDLHRILEEYGETTEGAPKM